MKKLTKAERHLLDIKRLERDIPFYRNKLNESEYILKQLKTHKNKTIEDIKKEEAKKKLDSMIRYENTNIISWMEYGTVVTAILDKDDPDYIENYDKELTKKILSKDS